MLTKTPTGNGKVEVTFAMPALEHVSKLYLVGDFNDWDANRSLMERLSPEGLWSVTLPISVGRHEYQFVVNDSLHITDPTAPQTSSEFGSANSVVSVGPRLR